MEAGADTSSAAAAAAVAPNLVSSDDMRSGHAGQGAAPTARSAATRRWWDRPLADWPEDELLLATGSAVVAELRAEVRRKLGYSCSAGVAHNKLLAKLGCGLHKPNQQVRTLSLAFRSF